MKEKLKDKKVLLSLVIALAFLLTIGITYAYFSIVVEGNEEAKRLNVSTTTLSILFTDGPEIIATEIFPGTSYTKTFIVTNTGTESVDFDILMSEMINTIERGELQYNLECHAYKNYNEDTEEDLGACEGVTNTSLTYYSYQKLKEKISIGVDVTNVYTLKVEFINKDEPQNYNQGKMFSGKIQIHEYKAPSLRDKILADNIIYRDDVASTYVSASTGVNFAAISSLTNGQGLYTNNKLEDGNNYYFRGGSFCAYEGYLSEDANGTKCKAAGGRWDNWKCSYDLSKEACEGHGQWYELKNNVSFGGYTWKIIRIDENGEVRLLYNGTYTTALGTSSHIGTVPYNEIAGDNAFVGYMQPTVPSEYQMSSGVKTNYFASNDSRKMSKTYKYDNKTGTFTLIGDVVNGTYTSEYIGYYTCESSEISCKWLIKIDEVDKAGTTNRVKKATILSSKFTTSKAQAEANEINSPVKTLNDNWYRDKLSSKSKKISKEAGYCNDRKTVEKDGGIGEIPTTFAPANRVLNNHTPSYKCPNESNDLFTMSTASKGNKKLTNPVGLITTDELAYAGSLTNTHNYKVYTHSGAWQWTMSPASFSGGLASVSAVNGQSILNVFNVYYGGGVRPVITLTTKALVTSGDGSLASPYRVE